MSASEDFVQADSANLPDMDVAVILEYVHTSEKYNISEIRAVKTLMASGSGYLQDAVGYVALSRNDNHCIIRAKILPEEKMKNKYCTVTISLNEEERTVTNTTCDGCPASEGGCKHTLVLLFWMEMKTTHPPEYVESYCTKPVSTSEAMKPMLIKDLVKPSQRECTLGPKDPEILKRFLEECKKRKITNSLIMSHMTDE